MRKPTEAPSANADLQAIQTSVAFKNISDAVEQYRRQFGLAFLALIAFSAVHVGLVVIANLYTLETRVTNGKLSAAADASTRPLPVATAKAEQVSDLAYIMSNLEESEQRELLSNIDSIDFVDADGNYRKYTVTGFQLGGWKRGDLKLYTAVGHVLSYVRGKGLRVDEPADANSTTETAANGRRLLYYNQQTYGATEFQSTVSAMDGLNPSAASLHSSDLCADQAFLQALNQMTYSGQYGILSSSSTTAVIGTLAASLEGCYSSAVTGAYDMDSTTDATIYASGVTAYVVHYIDNLLNHINANPATYTASAICAVDMFGTVQTHTYDDDGQGGNIYSAQTCTLGELTDDQYNLIGSGYFHGENHPHAGLEAFESMTHCLKSVVRGVLYEFSLLAGGSTDQNALNSWQGSSSVSSASIGLGHTSVGKGRKLLQKSIDFSSFDLASCDSAAYDIGNKNFDASNQEITGVDVTDSSNLGSYFDKVFTHNLCYLGVTIPDLINLAMSDGLFNALDDAANAAWDGSTHTVTYNGVTYNLPDVTSSWSWAYGPSYSLGQEWSTLKSLIDTVVGAAIATVSQDVTDCIGSNAGSFVAASKPLLEMAKHYLQTENDDGVTGMSAVVDYFVEKAHDIEEEAYTFESEMANSAVLGCTQEAFKCFYIQFRDDLEEQIRVEQSDALSQATTTQIHAGPDVYAATGSFTNDFSLPAAPCVPKVLVSLEDHSGSFESFLGGIGDQQWWSFWGSDPIQTATNSFGDDSFEQCEACLATVASGSKASAQFTYTDALSATMCSSISVLKSIYDDMVYQWGEYGVAYRESQELVYTAGVEEAQLYNQLQAEGWSSSSVTDGNKLAEKFVEDIVLVHIPETVSDMIDEYTSLQSTNLWKGFKEVNLTDVNFQSASYSFILPYSTGASTTGGYGCSGEDYKNLTNHNTELTIMGIDACGVSVEDQYRKPFISGAGFSSILGTYDQFSMYLSSRFCRMVVTMSTSTTGDSSGAVTAASSAEVEALIMLHGFGGDSGFLHLSAATAYFMDAGMPRFGNPDQWTAGQDDSGVVFLYPLAAEPTGSAMCTDDWAGGSTCVALMAPGGFLILAPDVSACPVSLRTWYLNSEFTGFIMDYVLFDLQMYIASQLLIPMTNSGIFGFSMGGFGTMNILAAYPYMATSAASFNAPVYPGGCFFFANCHQECALDIVLCELEFTTLGMVVNSYVLIFADTTVVSMGSMDPISVGVAAHLLAKQVQNPSAGTSAALRCGMYQATSGSEEVWGYYSVSSLPSGGACSWQDWSSSMNCDNLFSDNRDQTTAFNFGLNNFANSAPSSPSSIKLTFAKYTDSGFAPSAATQFTCSSCSVSFGADDINHNLPANHNVVLCPEVVCNDNKWCAETNMSEGADHYLNPLYAMIAAAKFVPASKPQSGQFASLQQVGVPVASSYVSFSLNSPLMKFNYNDNMYATYPMLLFMHCSQNDEYDLFTPHANYVELLMSTFFVFSRKRELLAPETTSENFNAKSVFTIDFYDCDWHRFSEKDMHKAMLFFSDAFRTYPVSFWVPAVMSNALASSDYSSNFGFCFLTKYSYVPSYSSHEETACPTAWSGSQASQPSSPVFWPSAATTLLAGSETVQGSTSSCEGSCTGPRASPHPPLMMKVSDWDIAHSFNEVECDITTLMLLIEELDNLSDSQENCSVENMAGMNSHDFTRWDPTNGNSATVCSSTEFAGGLDMNTCETSCTQLNSCYASNACPGSQVSTLEKLTEVDCVTLFPGFYCYYDTAGPTAFA